MIEAGMPDIPCVCGHKRSQHYFRRHYSSGHTDMSGEGICFACKTPDECLSFTWHEKEDTMSDQPQPAAKATCTVRIRQPLLPSGFTLDVRPCGLPAVESGPNGAWCKAHWEQGVKAPRKYTCIMCLGIIERGVFRRAGADYCEPCWGAERAKASAKASHDHVAAFLTEQDNVSRAQKDADAALGAVAGLAKQMLTLEEGIAEAFRLIDKQQDRLDAMSPPPQRPLCSRPRCYEPGEYHTTYAGTLCTEHAREYGQGTLAEEKAEGFKLPDWRVMWAVLGVSVATAVLVWQVAELVAVHWR